MSSVLMKNYGLILTGREYGINVAQEIANEFQPPFEFDFTEVLSLGSSFGDEIFKTVTNISKDKIVVINANKIVKAAIVQVAVDLKIEVDFK